ncbi:MAG: DUF3450 family protein [Verrucomicrobiota bacterium]
MKHSLFIFPLMTASMMGSNELELARTSLMEWVEVEKSISQESQSWIEKETTTLDLIAAMEKESEVLRERIEEMDAAATASDRTRAELVEKEATVDELQGLIKEFLPRMENELRSLRPMLPEPLSDKLQPFFGRLPLDSDRTTLGIAERMQTVAGILSTIQKFDEKITLALEMRDLADGETGEVQVLYLGLASAYYLSPNGEDAGLGRPTAAGWQWSSDPELAGRIEEAIAIYEGVQQEAKFLPLPLKLEGEG